MKKAAAIVSVLIICALWGGEQKEAAVLSKVQVSAKDNQVMAQRAETFEFTMDITMEQAKQEKAYAITAFEQPQLMYASGAVNVRSGPDTSYARVGGLARAQEISVTGQADTGWYEIDYNNIKAFVSNKYLQKDKPAAATPAQSGAGIILVGDSRFVQMQDSAGENSCVWIAQSGKGYQWFNDTAIAQIDASVGNGSKILINLGVNDPGNLKKYIELVNAKAAEWVSKGASVYYSSVNPVWENPHVSDEQVVYFNSQMVSNLSGNIQWIDSYTYLNTIGYKLVDGLHFNAETYQNLFSFYMSCL